LDLYLVFGLVILALNMSETKETKTARKGIIIALGITCIVLLILHLGVAAGNGAGYDSKPKHVMTKFLTATAVNKAVGLELTVQLEKTEYSLGEPVNMTFTLTNISNKTINLVLVSDIAWDYQVLNATNDLMFDYLSDVFTFGAVGFPVQIAAGQTITARFVWPQAYGPIPWFDGELLGITRITPVPPGTYYITGRFSNSSFTLQTSPLQIIIGQATHSQEPHSHRHLHPFDTMAKPDITNGHSRHASDGGIVTNHYADGTPVGDANTETTSM
jgi:hypothetical protein